MSTTARFEAVIFDLFITLTDFDAERRRPRCIAELADAFGVDRTTFVDAFRASFTERATADPVALAGRRGVDVRRLLARSSLPSFWFRRRRSGQTAAQSGCALCGEPPNGAGHR